MSDQYVEKVKSYVYYGSEIYVSLGSLKQMIWALCPFYMVAVASLISHTELVFSTMIVVLNALYIIAVLTFHFISEKVNSFALRFLINGIFSVYFSLDFLLVSLFFLRNVNASLYAYIFIIVFYLIFCLLYLYVAVWAKNRQKTNKKNSTKNNIVTASTIGAGIGVAIAAITDFNDKWNNYLLVAASLILSLLSALGIVNFLKYYYCKKYLIECDENGNNTSILLTNYDRKKKTPAKRILTILLYGLLIAFFVLLVKNMASL